MGFLATNFWAGGAIHVYSTCRSLGKGRLVCLFDAVFWPGLAGIAVARWAFSDIPNPAPKE